MPVNDPISAVEKKRKGAETYVAIRSKILESSCRHAANKSTDLREPLVAMMDWPVTNGIATVMAAADGTASIYLSNGGGFIGGGNKHAAIREAAIATIARAKVLLPKLKLTTRYPLPQPGEITFYVATLEGVFGVLVPEAEIRSSVSPFTPLGQAAMNVMTQYRLLYGAPHNNTVQ